MVYVARIYDPPDAFGRASHRPVTRVLVDRLWPRGFSTQTAVWDRWERDVAPSAELRRWFGHDPTRFAGFSARYRAELEAPNAAASLARLRTLAATRDLVLLTAARDREHSQAAVLKALLDEGGE